MSELAWFFASAVFVWYLVKTLSSAMPVAPQSTMEEDPATSFYDSDRYIPSVEDVITTKDSIHKNCKLPMELVDTIIDFAEYFPRTTMCRTGGELRVRAGRSGLGGHSEDRFIVSPRSNLENSC